MDVDHITNGQFIAKNHNTNKGNASSNSIIPPDNQSAIILQQFSIMTGIKTFHQTGVQLYNKKLPKLITQHMNIQATS